MPNYGKWPNLPSKKYINLTVIEKAQKTTLDNSSALVYGNIQAVRRKSDIFFQDVAKGDENGLGGSGRVDLGRVNLETQGGSRHHGEGLVPHITPASTALVSPCWPRLRGKEGWWVWGVGVLLLGMSRSWGVGTVFPPLHGSPLGCCFLVRG